MSKIAFKPNISGAGTLTVEAPASAVDRTLTLPDETGKLLTDNTPLPLANRNKIINGAMNIDQRNAGAAQTIVAGAALAYTIDRFYAFCTGANITGQQVDNTAGHGKEYKFTGAAGNTLAGFGIRMEALDTCDLAGKTAVFSMLSTATGGIASFSWAAYYANTTDTFGTLAAPTRTQIASGTVGTGTNSLIRKFSFDVPAAATTGIEIVITFGPLVAGTTFTIDDVQLEKGSVPSEFENIDIGLDYTKCKRYYETIQIYSQTYNAASAGNGVPVYFSAPKRVIPTIAATYRALINTTQESYYGTSIFGTQLISVSDAQAGVQRVINVIISVSAEL